MNERVFEFVAVKSVLPVAGTPVPPVPPFQFHKLEPGACQFRDSAVISEPVSVAEIV